MKAIFHKVYWQQSQRNGKYNLMLLIALLSTNIASHYCPNSVLGERFESNLNVGDPGPNSSRGTIPRNESRQAGKRRRRSLQEKIDAINRVRNGKSKAAVARDIGVPESTLRGWCKAEKKIICQNNKIQISRIVSGVQLELYKQYILRSSSDSNNSGAGGSSSRSTPTTQATMLGLPSTSGVTKRAEEFEAGPSYKRIKLENRNNNTVSNITTLALNMQQQWQQTNNTQLNWNKKKHSAPGLTSTMDIPKPSLRTQNNQSSNTEKSSETGSVSH
ncbi:PREDICTED: uncharacterized protein LOC108769768 [Trachymyrmex cornetzi]|uniref:uncharacterized protein LOC108769768 n=1 Tax=Trachymyrmex cornetzi TaxID=471704 RepID=UPI00084ED1FF|nr:PREDICTED: uncharacterized protein LOC108769768 [Trachymyrmex cornetzi]